VVELETERGDERSVVEQGLTGVADEVGGDTASGEEALEVDGRSVDGGVAPTGPLDLGDLQPTPLGGLGDGLGLQDVGVEGAGAVREGVAVLVEGVVGRSVGTRPGAGGQGVPARSGVRRGLREQAEVPFLRNSAMVGIRPCAANVDTRSWRMPSETK
jgi:hypothetical protein